MKKLLTCFLCVSALLVTGLSSDAKKAKQPKQEQSQMKDARFYYNEGIRYEQHNNKEGAIDVYAKAVELDPNFDAARIAKAQLSYFYGRYEEALADFEYLETRPGYGAGAFFDSRIDCRLKLGQYDKALDDMYEVILAYCGQVKVYKQMQEIVTQHPELAYKLKPEAHKDLIEKYKDNAKIMRDYARTFKDARNNINEPEMYDFFMGIAIALNPETLNTEWDGTVEMGSTVYRKSPSGNEEVTEVKVNSKQDSTVKESANNQETTEEDTTLEEAEQKINNNQYENLDSEENQEETNKK